jgi:hypothetical protein
MAELNSFVARHGTALLETVDDWLTHRRQERQHSSRNRKGLIRPYLGLYLSTDTEASHSPLKVSKHQSGARQGRRKARKTRPT